MNVNPYFFLLIALSLTFGWIAQACREPFRAGLSISAAVLAFIAAVIALVLIVMPAA